MPASSFISSVICRSHRQPKCQNPSRVCRSPKRSRCSGRLCAYSIHAACEWLQNCLCGARFLSSIRDRMSLSHFTRDLSRSQRWISTLPRYLLYSTVEWSEPVNRTYLAPCTLYSRPFLKAENRPAMTPVCF